MRARADQHDVAGERARGALRRRDLDRMRTGERGVSGVEIDLVTLEIRVDALVLGLLDLALAKQEVPRGDLVLQRHVHAVEAALAEAGLSHARVVTRLSPAWSTADISETGRRKLLAFGIAPPQQEAPSRALFADAEVACPRCGSSETVKISEFGSTACKAQWRCRACAA